ncbi:hypothetical protein QYE76_060365 [Lolium multiflorum]|uniref:F-box domain-containing protein n=1 Tax=Lolium multiflorum TaxID=4521 RepID=A0AAD8W5B1_LOLMU|nr:hypothetical protein QYE76_060365 [Lolium multiflorum]
MDDAMPEATAVSLPNDVIFDILSRTPMKPVCRFRCVSKGWHGLISDQAFLAAYKLRHTDPFLVDTGFFRGNKKPDLRLMDMDGNVVRVFEGIGGSGMFPTTSLDSLISVWDGSCEDVHHGHESCESIHVVDPVTGEVLFTSPGHEVIEDDFTEYYKIFSIGRATPSGVYKVVRLVGGNICDVITLGDDTGWRRKTWPWPVPKYRLDRGCSPVTIDGVMYFLIKGTSDVTLVCFDLESERWKDDTIEGPQTVGGAETTVPAHDEAHPAPPPPIAGAPSPEMSSVWRRLLGALALEPDPDSDPVSRCDAELMLLFAVSSVTRLHRWDASKHRSFYWVAAAASSRVNIFNFLIVATIPYFVVSHRTLHGWVSNATGTLHGWVINATGLLRGGRRRPDVE